MEGKWERKQEGKKPKVIENIFSFFYNQKECVWGADAL